jgi:succinate dehydrogenase/fumarate reductase cytochrome b subunit
VEPAARSNETQGAWLERVFTFTSVLPVGAFVLVHVLDYGRILFGVEEVGGRELPFWVPLLEAVLVWLPFSLHAVLGIFFWRKRRAAPDANPSERALLGVHRLSGLVVLLFLVDHFLRFRLPILEGKLVPADSVQRLAAELSRTQAGFPWIAALGLLGVTAAAFHLGYGLRRIAQSSPKFAASRVARALPIGVGLLVLFAGLFSMLYLAAG